MEHKRNRLVAPRNIVNAKMIYSFYILNELSKGGSLIGNNVLDTFKGIFTKEETSFPVSSSTVYETLYSLEENGYITSNWTGDDFLNKRTRKHYRITDEGMLYYKNHIADYVDNINKTKSTLDKIIKIIS